MLNFLIKLDIMVANDNVAQSLMFVIRNDKIELVSVGLFVSFSHQDSSFKTLK